MNAGIPDMAESRLGAARDWGARESDDGETQSLVLHIDSGSRRVVLT